VCFKLANGSKIKLWLDWWIGEDPLFERFPLIFDIVADQNIFIHRALVGNEWLIRLKHNLSLEALEQWNELMDVLQPVALSTDPDSVSWALESSGVFSSRSLYLKINQRASVPHAKEGALHPIEIKNLHLAAVQRALACLGTNQEAAHLMGDVFYVRNLIMLPISSSTVLWQSLCGVGCALCSRCLRTLRVLLMFLAFSNALMAKLVG
jgi:hypothetical protein